MAGGRPKIEVDWSKVDAMCQIQCTGEEIASVLDISYDTLERRCKEDKDCSFADYIGEKKQGGRASLRRKQWKLAESGNPTMLTWLGKQYLKQKDKQETDLTSSDGSMTPDRLGDAELDKKIEEKLKAIRDASS